MAEDLDSLVAVAKTKIGDIIQKPKMTEKLLSKPPFRFIHDTISAITAQTGFGEGLYSGPELDSAAITEKQAKLDYLDKIFRLVGICKGSQLEVRSTKVVQGLEAEFTNKFFIALAEVCVDGNLDFAEAVRRTLAGENPGEKGIPLKRSSQPPPRAEAKVEESAPAPAAKPQAGNKEDKKPTEDLDAKLPVDIDQMVAPERGKSRGGTRGGKPNQATADTGLGGFGSATPKLDAEIEKCDGTEATTQALLGALITRPKLTEKLLSKPPFRFLHDIVMEVIRSTGFARGLYSDAECDSANVADKEQKMKFLEKVIKVVGVHLNTLVEAKPSRIVAGMDAQNTNNFLQLLAVAAKHMPDSTNAVRTVLEEFGEVAPSQQSSTPMDSSPPPRAESKEQAPPTSRFDPPQQTVEDTKVEERKQAVRQSQAAPVQSEPKEVPMAARQDDRREVFPDDKTSNEPILEGDGEQKRSARPTTARRRPPKVKDGAKEVQSKDIAPVASGPKKTNIIVDGAADDDDDEAIPDETRLADDLKSESKNEDQVGNPQSKLVQDIMSRQAEQEAATRSTNRTEIVDESKNNDAAPGGSGIRLGKLRKTGIDKKGGSSAAATFAEGDLEKMRSAIQSLVQQTGPLGTCMDFIQEDISSMNAELHKWEEECRKYEMEYEEAKRKTKETLHPLKVELADLEDQIAEQIARISSSKATNAKNDEKIQQILKLIATA